MKMIRIPRRKLKFGNSANCVVPAFSMLRRPVTIGSYALFSKTAGYVTEAERERLEFTYFQNPSIDNVAIVDIDSIVCNWVSWNDAAEYCKFYSVRLPSALQWQSFVEFIQSNDLYRLERTNIEDAIFFSSPEWLHQRWLLGRVLVAPLMEEEKSSLPSVDMCTKNQSLRPDMSRTFRFVIS
jgi:hypothetical protein